MATSKKGAQRVFIARGEHPTIPGQHFSVHATRKGAARAALKSLNIIRKDLGMCEVDKFDDLYVQYAKQEYERQEGDPDDLDVWIDVYTVRA